MLPCILVLALAPGMEKNSPVIFPFPWKKLRANCLFYQLERPDKDGYLFTFSADTL